MNNWGWKNSRADVKHLPQSYTWVARELRYLYTSANHWLRAIPGMLVSQHFQLALCWGREAICSFRKNTQNKQNHKPSRWKVPDIGSWQQARAQERENFPTLGQQLIKILQIPLLHRTPFFSELKLLSFPYWLLGVMKVRVYLLLNPKRMPASILALVLKWGIFNTYCPQFGNFNGNSDNRSLFQPHYRDFVT